MHGAIRAVLFDFDHTLGTDNKLEERALQMVAERHCVHAPSAEDVAGALARFRSGDVELAAMLADAFEEWGYTGDVLEEFKVNALSLLPLSLVAMPAVTETLKALRDAGKIVAILSNGWTELQRAKADLVGFRGPIFVSEEIDAWKPDRRAFEIAANELEVKMSESFYVGDSPVTDVAGAKAAGMVAVWANLEGAPYPGGIAEPDYTIATLPELIPLAVAYG